MALFGMSSKRILDEVKKCLEEENYEAAAEAADKIPVHKVKTASEFNILGRVYKKNKDYRQAKQMFKYSYEERCSRATLVELMDCCLQTAELEDAENYFDEYHRIASEDKATLYIYRYKIEEKKGRDAMLLIPILEELKAVDYREEYAYELAKLYHKSGRVEDCMNECRDIILWFDAGVTVERAKALLAYYKGEISLEDIKAAGERYMEKQRLQQEIQEEITESDRGAEASEEITEEAEQRSEQPEREWPEGQKEQLKAEEILPEGHPVEEITPEEDVQKGEELPKIDLSGLGFPEMESMHQKEERFVPFSPEDRTENTELAGLFAKKQIRLADEMKNFARMEQIHKQILKSLELVLTDRKTTFFVVAGDKKTGKTTFAFAFIRLLYHLELIRYDRTATIRAVQLNQISLDDCKEELRNCNLIIEEAGGMTKETADAVWRFAKNCSGRNCVILEDSVRSVNKLLRGREDLNALFGNRITLGKYSAGDLFGFAYDLIEKAEYCVDKAAAEVLAEKIEEIVKRCGEEERLTKTLEAATDALARAEERNGEVLLSMAREGRFREGNYQAVLPEDIIFDL